jgi:hypothetical protein
MHTDDWEGYDDSVGGTGAHTSDDEGGDGMQAAGAGPGSSGEGLEALGGRKAVSKWFDSGVLRQKEAKAAVLAIRKHLR